MRINRLLCSRFLTADKNGLSTVRTFISNRIHLKSYMKKFLLVVATASVALFSAHGMKYTCGSFNSSKKTCTLTGWSGSQPSSGKLTIPSTFTHTDGVTYTITAVASGALNDLTDVTDITVPTSVVVIGNSNSSSTTQSGVENFQNCPNLISFHVDSSHAVFSTKNSGILCSKDGEVLYRVPAELAVDTDGEVTLNSKIKYITNGSFVDNASIKLLVLPPSVASISKKAGFNTMKSLAKFTLSSSNEDYKVIDGALIDTWMNQLLSYPPKRTNQNVTITTPVIDILVQAFANTKYLKTLVLPQSVVMIEDEAFYNSSVTSVTMPKKLENLGGRVFAKSKLENITMWAPTSFDGYVEDIFAYCTNLKTMTINGNNPRFNKGFARGCTALTTVSCAVTPKEIRTAAFKGCTSLTSFPFSASTDAYGDSIFAETGFVEVKYPSDEPIDGLESYMFYGCRQLEKIDLSAVTGPESNRFLSIKPYSICGCPKLKEIIFPQYTSFSGYSTGDHWPNIGPACPLEKIVIQSFSTYDDRIFIFEGGGLYTPNVYIKTTGLTNCHGEWDKLFYAANGAQVRPNLYCEGWEPASQYHYLVENATYYIPGSCSDNYKDAVESSKCTVKEMFSLEVYNIAGKIKVVVKPNISGVTVTYVTFNEAFGAAPNASGEVSMGNSFSDTKQIRVSYTVKGEKMSTIYPRTQFSDAPSIAADASDFKAVVDLGQLILEGVDEDAVIEIYTLSGSRTMATTGTGTDLSQLPAGVYILRVADNSGVRVQKILVN